MTIYPTFAQKSYNILQKNLIDQWELEIEPGLGHELSLLGMRKITEFYTNLMPKSKVLKTK